MSLFSVGGNAGFALGPLVATGLVFIAGLKGIALYLIPALITGFILLSGARSLSRFNKSNKDEKNTNNSVVNHISNNGMNDAWVPFIVLTLAIICRSILFQGINTFLPSYWIEIFHVSKEQAATALTIMLGMGVVGNLVGGRLADRFGNRKTSLTGFILLIPQLFLFVNMTHMIPATILLMTIGFTSFVSFSPMIVMGQQFLPNRVGFASGITIGLAVSVGGFAAPLLGRLADISGVQAVFHLLVIFPILASALLYLLPKPIKRSVLNH